jgi:5'-deoxynucleotidase YfbR-like HD superfamily hydrolase
MEIHDAGRTRRFHSISFSRVQTIGEHSWNVAQLLRYLWPSCSHELLLAALDHDVPERLTGDIPSPFKKQLGVEFKDLIIKIEREIEEELGLSFHHELTDEEKHQLAVVDVLDFILAAKNEVIHGNTHRDVFNTMKRGISYLEEQLSNEKDGEVIRKIYQLMEVDHDNK